MWRELPESTKISGSSVISSEHALKNTYNASQEQLNESADCVLDAFFKFMKFCDTPEETRNMFYRGELVARLNNDVGFHLAVREVYRDILAIVDRICSV